MGRHKNTYIPYSVFHKIWDEAYKSDTLDAYIGSITGVNSDKRIFFMRKYKIPEDKALELLTAIWDIKTIGFNEIVKKAGKRKADISHELCIPIRTIEDWCNNKSSCPGYTKLMILKHYNLFSLPTGIAIGPEPAKEPPKEKEVKKELPTISDEILLQSTRHRTYIEIQRAMEDRTPRIYDDPVGRYLHKKGRV